jgi:hypothetical protein
LDSFHAMLNIIENISPLVHAYLDQEISSLKRLVGVILGKQTSRTGVGIFLLGPRGDYYQRASILWYSDGRGIEAGGDCIPHIVYVDAEQNVVGEIENVGACPLWLHRAEVRTLGVG